MRSFFISLLHCCFCWQNLIMNAIAADDYGSASYTTLNNNNNSHDDKNNNINKNHNKNLDKSPAPQQQIIRISGRPVASRAVVPENNHNIGPSAAGGSAAGGMPSQTVTVIPRLVEMTDAFEASDRLTHFKINLLIKNIFNFLKL
jgi:hypothetical protein